MTDIAGTTRDSIYTRYDKFGFDFYLVDTAGIRRKNKVSEDLEFYSVMRSIRAIENSDVCILMIDATRGIETQDMNIFQLIQKNQKSLVVVVNKWDLVEDKSQTAVKFFEEAIRKRMAPFTDFPVVFASAVTKQRIFKVLETAKQVYLNRKVKIGTTKLNEVMLPLIDVEQVVLQLEGQSDLLTELIEVLLVFLRGTGQDGTDLHGTGQQHARLQTDHLDILFLAHVVAGLKLHVELLSFIDLVGRHQEGFEHVLQLVGLTGSDPAESLQQHGVAREDGLIGIPLPMHRLMTAPHVGIVHQVVVQQGEVVIGLQSEGLRHNAQGVVLEEVVGQQHQYGAHTLATDGQHILDGFIQR